MEREALEFKAGPTEYRGDGLCRAGVGGLKAYLEYSGLLNDDAAVFLASLWTVRKDFLVTFDVL